MASAPSNFFAPYRFKGILYGGLARRLNSEGFWIYMEIQLTPMRLSRKPPAQPRRHNP